MSAETEWATLQRWDRHDQRMATLERTKTAPSLYGPAWEHFETERIRDECADELGCAPEPSQVDQWALVDLEYSGSGHAGMVETCTCGAQWLQTFEGEHGWACEACDRPTREIWGCLECARVVCDRCVRRRRFEREDGKTLEVIALQLGVTRERVRQHEVKAFQKLRESPLARQLWEGSWTTDPAWAERLRAAKEARHTAEAEASERRRLKREAKLREPPPPDPLAGWSLELETEAEWRESQGFALVVCACERAFWTKKGSTVCPLCRSRQLLDPG